ncbi:hypothetical protein COY07_01660 [Candidatus Peregrinibacteria bacterium CG_4_10_14_0_2_um_filter_43_11]|nr:MAG: hypothetical protein COY07_01660 [Candidatus Peregrinibacteria bacterium CG_4_10_14_0_2_um_filter_43_11]
MSCCNHKCCHYFCLILLIVGGLNWGLVGLGGLLGKELNVVHMLVGTWPTVEWIVYLLVGLAAVVKLIKMVMCHTKCSCAPQQ